MKRKCLTLLVPYLMWNLVAFVVEPSHFSKSPMEIITGFYGIEGHGPWDGPLWFMRDLFLLMLIAPAIEKVVKSTKIILPLIFWLVYASNCARNYPILNMDYVSFAFFTIGAYLGIWQKEFIVPLRKYRIVVIALYFLMITARIITMHHWGNIIVGTTTISSLVDMLYIVATIPAWFIIASYVGERTQHLDVWRWLASSGFVVYAMHRLFNSKVSAVGLVLLGKPEISGMEAVALYFATITITVLVCLSTYLVFANLRIGRLLFLGSRKRT